MTLFYFSFLTTLFTPHHCSTSTTAVTDNWANYFYQFMASINYTNISNFHACRIPQINRSLFWLLLTAPGDNRPTGVVGVGGVCCYWRAVWHLSGGGRSLGSLLATGWGSYNFYRLTRWFSLSCHPVTTTTTPPLWREENFSRSSRP